jgi:hypothetical protein
MGRHRFTSCPWGIRHEQSLLSVFHTARTGAIPAAGNRSVTVRGKAAVIYWKTASEVAAAKEDAPAAMAQKE